MKKLFVFGSINMDLIFTVKRLPKKGETIKSEAFTMAPGGKGANQAVAAAKQNLKTIMLGSLGTDLLSRQLKAGLEANQVDTAHIREIEGKTAGIAGILLEETDNRIIIDAGANAFHDSESLKAILRSEASKDDILLAQLEVPINTIKELFKQAKILGMTTILNAAPAEKLPESLYPLIDMMILNETECETISEMSPDTPENIKQATGRILEKGVKSVVLTYGANGSAYHDGTRHISMPAFKVEASDTTGAGDAFIGVLTSALARGLKIEAALRRASAAGAMTVLEKGAQTALPTRSGVDAFLKRHTDSEEQ